MDAQPDLPEVVFIIARRVVSAATQPLWGHSYASIRRAHPAAPILIIDDGSSYPPGDARGAPPTNCTVIASEFPQRGELLPYYYFHKLHPARKAVVVHDSVFVNQPLDVSKSARRTISSTRCSPRSWGGRPACGSSGFSRSRASASTRSASRSPATSTSGSSAPAPSGNCRTLRTCVPRAGPSLTPCR